MIYDNAPGFYFSPLQQNREANKIAIRNRRYAGFCPCSRSEKGCQCRFRNHKPPETYPELHRIRPVMTTLGRDARPQMAPRPLVRVFSFKDTDHPMLLGLRRSSGKVAERRVRELRSRRLDTPRGTVLTTRPVFSVSPAPQGPATGISLIR